MAALDILQGAEKFAQTYLLPAAIAIGGTLLIKLNVTRTIGENEVGIHIVNKRATGKYPPHALHKAWRAGRHGRWPGFTDIAIMSVADEKEEFEPITLHRKDGVQYIISHNVLFWGLKCPSVRNPGQKAGIETEAEPDPTEQIQENDRTTELPPEDAARLYRALFETDGQPLGRLALGKCIQSLGVIMPTLEIDEFEDRKVILSRVKQDIDEELDFRWGIELRDLTLGTFAVTGSQLGNQAIRSLAPDSSGIVHVNGNTAGIIAAAQTNAQFFNS